MAWFLYEQLSLPNINHYRCEGSWISDAERLWKMVMIMRSIPDKLPYWIRVVSHSSADIGWFARDLGEGLAALEQVSPHLTLLAAAHVCQCHMLVCVVAYTLSVEPLYLTPTEAKLVVSLVSQQAITPWKLGQFLVMTVTRAQYLMQWKDIAAVSVVFLEWAWQGDGNGTGPCCTKRIMKTKQHWQVWNLSTLPERYEDYQSQAVCWRDGSVLFCAPMWVWWTRRKIHT